VAKYIGRTYMKWTGWCVADIRPFQNGR